jgi:hypothetical protein
MQRLHAAIALRAFALCLPFAAADVWGQGAPVLLWDIFREGAGEPRVTDAQETSDGTLLILGYLEAAEGQSPVTHLAALDPGGQTVWERTMDLGDLGYASALAIAPDGGLVIGGRKLVRLNAAGEESWELPLRGGAVGLERTADGAFIVAGSFGAPAEIYLLKADDSGSVVWERTFALHDGPDSPGSQATSVLETRDSGFLVTGLIWVGSVMGGTYRGALIKTDGSGTVEWQQFVRPGETGLETSVDFAVEAAEGGFLVGGAVWCFEPENNSDFLLARTDASGETLWRRAFDRGKYEGAFRMVHAEDDGGYFVAGTDLSMPPAFHLLRTDAALDVVWEWELPGFTSGPVLGIREDGFFIAGQVWEMQDFRGTRWMRLAWGDTALFARGDANGDGEIDISDPLFTLGFLFLGTALPGCMDALDADDSGVVDISDAVGLLTFLFLGGPPPPLPFRDCGFDRSLDALDCHASRRCGP